MESDRICTRGLKIIFVQSTKPLLNMQVFVVQSKFLFVWSQSVCKEMYM